MRKGREMSRGRAHVAVGEVGVPGPINLPAQAVPREQKPAQQPLHPTDRDFSCRPKAPASQRVSSANEESKIKEEQVF